MTDLGALNAVSHKWAFSRLLKGGPLSPGVRNSTSNLSACAYQMRDSPIPAPQGNNTMYLYNVSRDILLVEIIQAYEAVLRFVHFRATERA